MAKIRGTTGVSATIAPASDTSKFPATSEQWHKGGFKSFANTAERDEMKASYKKDGMLCYIIETSEFYILKGDAWQKLEFNSSGATYAQIVASLKYLGLELPTTIKAYRDYDLFSDDRVTGDLSITFTPIEYVGSYGQAWENVAIYNENDEKLVAKYASISSDGLTIEAVFAKDIAHPKSDNWEAVPEDYVLLEGEVRATITLGAANYYGNTYGLRMLNNNPSSYSESFLASSHNTSPWVFRFHNYKPSKFSITNGTTTYSGYGYMTKYNLTLSVGNWSKTLTYENSVYPNDIEINFRGLIFSDAKTFELAKAWGVLMPYDPNIDIKES